MINMNDKSSCTDNEEEIKKNNDYIQEDDLVYSILTTKEKFHLMSYFNEDQKFPIMSGFNENTNSSGKSDFG